MAKTPVVEPSPKTAANAQPRAVLFVGGSVTQGAWASPGKDYVTFLTDWLTTKIGSVTMKNIAVGGTNSQFAVYRLEQDLDGFKPDIAFVEFSVNDEPDRAFVYENIDGLIYKLRRVNPNVVIIYIAASYPGEAALRRAGSSDDRVVYAREIVEKNGAIFVDAASHLWHHINLTNRNPQDFFADVVHPNDLGHSSYYLSISQQLDERIVPAKGVGARSSLYIGQSRLDTARLVDPLSLITNTTCPNGPSSHLDFVGQSIPYDDLQYRCRPSDIFTIAFSGTSIGLTTRAMVGGGKLDCTIDGSETSSFNFEDSATRLRVVMLFEYQRAGNHTVLCKTIDGPVEFGQILVSSANQIRP
ncbi:GDSL-type esterase/lipase family protein [Rhodopseudomonas sp. HC1]|uniref:GDSL-type esterase/lipase family protein n=1 Tax=Rhodopseudomonas infernalis TaxID=2897386 RepID=UPI001EE8F2F6|nr:SGNH/GDSL hydrolase family protein [Rhodopseudomonas infernalis]MCG6203140.1 GDSL-type esterase/lipase family protein [Rhodopseudomonas infernalis]